MYNCYQAYQQIEQAGLLHPLISFIHSPLSIIKFHNLVIEINLMLASVSQEGFFLFQLCSHLICFGDFSHLNNTIEKLRTKTNSCQNNQIL